MDQSNLPHCVGFAWAQWLRSSPIRTLTGPEPDDIYHQAQLVDEWEGKNYDGTSVRAGAKVLAPHIAEYRWADDLQTLKEWLLLRGPVVMGTNWYTNMDYPVGGIINLGGGNVGGHAYLCLGWNSITRRFRCINSWGAGWGQNGRFWIREDDMARLLAENGEACAAIERTV